MLKKHQMFAGFTLTFQYASKGFQDASRTLPRRLWRFYEDLFSFDRHLEAAKTSDPDLDGTRSLVLDLVL